MPPTKTAAKNTRWALMEQRVEFLEEKMNSGLEQINRKMDEIKKDNVTEVVRLSGTITELKDMQTKFQEKVSDKFEALVCKITDNKIAITKIVAGVGALLAIIEIALKVWK